MRNNPPAGLPMGMNPPAIIRPKPVKIESLDIPYDVAVKLFAPHFHKHGKKVLTP